MSKVESINQFKSKKFAFTLVILLHFFGAIGYQSSLSEWFLYLTPVNLLITAGMIWVDSQDENKLGWPIALLIVILGYTVEIIGVKTGFPFGHYSYGEVLGWKFFEVPPVIGMNWLIVVWACFSVAVSLGIGRYGRWLAVGLLAVLIDVLIEPVAVHYGWWQWQGGSIPWYNYAAWFVTAAVMAVIFEQYPLVKKPRIGVVVFFCQLGFFLALYWALG